MWFRVQLQCLASASGFARIRSTGARPPPQIAPQDERNSTLIRRLGVGLIVDVERGLVITDPGLRELARARAPPRRIGTEP